MKNAIIKLSQTLGLLALVGFASNSYATIIEVDIGFDGVSAAGGTKIVTTQGFEFNAIDLTPSQCDSDSEEPCILATPGDTFTLSHTQGFAFTLNSFWFELSGNSNPNFLGVCVGSVAPCVPDDFIFSVTSYPSGNGGQYLYNSDNFQGKLTAVTAITFYASSGGTVRIDDFLDLSYDDGNGGTTECEDGQILVEDICVDEDPVDVPEPGTLGLLGLGLLGLAARRRRTV